jgi:hypothetical protein
MFNMIVRELGYIFYSQSENTVLRVFQMDEKSLIFGVSYAVDDLIIALLNQKIDLNFEEDYYLNISPPPIPGVAEEFGDSVISGIFVDLSVELVEAVLVWLRNIKQEHMENPKLKITVDGNILSITVQDMEMLLEILKEWSSQREQWE